jgi:hypothetical protein
MKEKTKKCYSASLVDHDGLQLAVRTIVEMNSNNKKEERTTLAVSALSAMETYKHTHITLERNKHEKMHPTGETEGMKHAQ